MLVTWFPLRCVYVCIFTSGSGGCGGCFINLKLLSEKLFGYGGYAMEVTDDEFPAGVDKPEDQEVPDLELPDEEDIDKLVSGVSDGLSSPLQLTHAFSETDSAVEQSIYDRA